MLAIETQRICDAANSDPEMRIAARFWDAVIRLDSGADTRLFAFRGGEAVEAPPEGAFAYDVRIAAAPEVWAEMLAPVPAAFYHDLFAAAARHGVVLEGDIEAYYPALRRLLEILRTLANSSSVPPT